ncbi:hypothetical protein PUMCH_000770 [Australozyma saopauloensis]|uniref:Amino-acid acetyltransferase, mitochondrial n=1 Tax=Australozyma saopauloensis TaxID=291208 RepID=A0AAX4H5K5_9ASCO|nr:hypothetical protein PUMCH_000770 [[Candida] saopauloensis]
MTTFTNLSKKFVSNLTVNQLITKAKRDLILSILKSTTTKREAREYLNKYQSQFNPGQSYLRGTLDNESLSLKDNQLNLFINRFLDGENPFLRIYEDEDEKIAKIPLRLAIFKLYIHEASPEILKGTAETFRRLVNLGISPVIVLDPGNISGNSYKQSSLYVNDQIQTLLKHVFSPTGDGLQLLDSTILRCPYSLHKGTVKSVPLEQIMIPLYQGIIPIILPAIYDTENGFQHFINADSAVKYLCADLLNTSELLTLEKVIFVDKHGGVPSVERNQTSHVFINLSQEFSDILSELYIGYLDPKIRDIHIDNLVLMNDILNDATSKAHHETTGIITTPAMLALNDDQLNPIIYNVLTDRPVILSSLPSSTKRTPQLSTSIIKRGFPVSVLEEHTYNGEFTFKNLVRDKLVDQDRLFSLLEDSFGRKLAAEEFLERINLSIATIIIVGDYDGAAIITWETLSSGEKIAYLDKFAIAKKNQGLPSLADIIFKLISQAHQSELIWRSRNNNPVNKWYFERSRGSANVPDSQWKLYFTGEIYDKRMGTKLDGTENESVDITQKLKIYSEVVLSIPPSFK